MLLTLDTIYLLNKTLFFLPKTSQCIILGTNKGKTLPLHEYEFLL